MVKERVNNKESGRIKRREAEVREEDFKTFGMTDEELREKLGNMINQYAK